MIRRGQIYMMDFDPVHGREQAGRRPALVVSSDAINAQPLVVTVVPGTDASKVRTDFSTNVRSTAEESGLPMDTVFLCFQVRSVDHERLEGLVGCLPQALMKRVDEALRRVLALN